MKMKTILVDLLLCSVFLFLIIIQFLSNLIPFITVIILSVLIIIRLVIHFTKRKKQEWRRILLFINISAIIVAIPIARFGIHISNVITDNNVIENMYLYDDAVNYIKSSLLTNEYEYRQIVNRKGDDFDELNKLLDLHDEVNWPDKYDQLAMIVLAGRNNQNVISIEFIIRRNWGVPTRHSARSIIYQSNNILDDRYKNYTYKRHIAPCWFGAIP